jgi:4Fe-4S ferredoxin
MKQKRTNAAKVRRAANDPARPGERCEAEPGIFAPRIDRARCEGKGDCIEVCPHDVFEIGHLTPEQFSALPMLGKVKALVHGKKTALTPGADQCRACGLCVVACPEKAITLTPTVVRRVG